ncbi:MAG: deoxyribodipyrimidine photo-lyase [Henriciella sp.]|jgi:deoxyribodipyrimidine photo-lyase
MWFRRDLRLHDNPALNAAVQTGASVVCLYILETDSALRPMGGASQWWLDKSLKRLRESIEDIGGQLLLKRGLARETLDEIVSQTGANAVFWNRRYDQADRDIDSDIKQSLKQQGLGAESYNGSLLTEPWTQKTGSGGYYKVFTPYWKSVQANYQPSAEINAPTQLKSVPKIETENIEDWVLHPTKPDWSNEFEPKWVPGEKGAAQRLQAFISGPVSEYKDHRNRPDLEKGTSGLSPHLAFGEIGPAQIWRATQAKIKAGDANQANAMTFLSEVVWREFSYVLLYHNPDLATENYKPAFNAMPWREDEAGLKAWQQGRTGYPIVDAGMRQLWATGWMHNRVRMIVASFLTKHLLLHWSHGEDWFWDTLVDADPAANSASWQWTAGSGADAAPYFRVFNPITQGEKFDESGDYVRKWCPELARLPHKFLYQPWEAGPLILHAAGVKLGETYPHPIVDHKEGRQRALDAYAILKERRDAA